MAWLAAARCAPPALHLCAGGCCRRPPQFGTAGERCAGCQCVCRERGYLRAISCRSSAGCALVSGGSVTLQASHHSGHDAAAACRDKGASARAGARQRHWLDAALFICGAAGARSRFPSHVLLATTTATMRKRAPGIRCQAGSLRPPPPDGAITAAYDPPSYLHARPVGQNSALPMNRCRQPSLPPRPTMPVHPLLLPSCHH